MTELITSRDEFSRLFDTFEHTAFRLEVREAYAEPGEREPLRKFLAGEPDDARWHRPWLSYIRKVTGAGCRFTRVRVVSRPLSDYSRFGLAGAIINNSAGEDIRYLERPDAVAAGLPDHDYWLFDSRKLAVMHFADDDRLLGFELVEDPSAIVQHNYWRDVAWHLAVKREDFATEEQTERV